MPVDPQPFDYGELQKGQTHNQVYSRAGGTRKSHTDLQSARGGGAASRKDVSGKGSRKLSVRKLVFTVADNGIESNLNRDSDGNDEGRYWSGARRDNRGASRMSPF